MFLIAKNLGELADRIISLRTHCNHSDYPTEFQAYDEAWDELRQNLNHLRGKLGDKRYAQLMDMAAQAKAHYDAESEDEHQGFLGSWLMQDIEQVVRGKPPFAYPEELYRWPR